jgi:hypothetical protein
MAQGNLKPRKQYIFYRIYCLVVMLTSGPNMGFGIILVSWRFSTFPPSVIQSGDSRPTAHVEQHSRMNIFSTQKNAISENRLQNTLKEYILTLVF